MPPRAKSPRAKSPAPVKSPAKSPRAKSPAPAKPSAKSPRTKSPARANSPPSAVASPAGPPAQNGSFLKSLLSWLLFLAVLINQTGRNMVPSIKTSVIDDGSMPVDADNLAPMLTGVSAVCLGGKFLGGAVTDKLGGWVVLVAVFATFAASSAVLIGSTTAETFGAMWLVNSLAYTITWGAAVQVIGVAFDETERPAQLTKAASASRFGASLGSMMFGTLLKAGLTWRQALMPAVPIQILIGLGCLYCWSAMPKSNSEAVAKKPSADGKEATDKKKKAEAAPSGLTAFASFDLWLMLIPKVVLFTYTQFFMNFVSSLLKKSYGFSDGDATFMQGVTQGGSVIGLLVLGNMVYKTLSPPRQVLLVAAELLVCTAVPLLLALQQGSSLPDPVSALISPLVVPLLTLWGCAYALPFYLPPGEFAIKIGGKSAAAFFTNLFDAAGFTLCMFWNPWASKASKDGDFTIVLLSMSAFGALALLTMPLCMHRMQAAGSEEKKRA